MATTSFGVNDSLSNKLWAKKLSAEALKETYFSKFMGTSANSMIHIKNESATNAGDKVTFGLRMQLQGAGVTESQALVGNEESLTTYFDAVVLNELAHAVRVRNKSTIDAQRIPFNLRNEAKDGLSGHDGGGSDSAHRRQSVAGCGDCGRNRAARDRRAGLLRPAAEAAAGSGGGVHGGG